MRKGLYPGVRGEGGLAIWPKGRLVALECEEEGAFATIAVIPKGDRIRLNATVKPTGYVKVAARRFDRGEDIPGRTFDESDQVFGDGLALPITWNGEENLNHEGAGIILRFELKQVKLYGVEFY